MLLTYKFIDEFLFSFVKLKNIVSREHFDNCLLLLLVDSFCTLNISCFCFVLFFLSCNKAIILFSKKIVEKPIPIILR